MRDAATGLLEEIANQARHWLAWFDEPRDAKTWDLNVVAASTRALLNRLEAVLDEDLTTEVDPSV